MLALAEFGFGSQMIAKLAFLLLPIRYLGVIALIAKSHISLDHTLLYDKGKSNATDTQ